MRAHFIPPDTYHPAGSGGGPGEPPPDASTLGVKIFLASLSMLFGASLLGYVITRFQVDDWQGYEIPGLRFGLAVSTVFLVGCSWFIHRGLAAARRDDSRGLRIALWVTAGLALAFLVNQTFNWAELIEFHGGLQRTRDVSLFLFYALTSVHALHVLGGFVPLGIVLAKAQRGAYTSRDHRGLVNCALYWHFLDLVWVLIAVTLWIG